MGLKPHANPKTTARPFSASSEARCYSGKAAAPFFGPLVFEDLVQELVVDLVELLQRALDRFLVVAGNQVQVLAEAVGGAVHQHLGVLEALGVAREIEMDQVSVAVDLPRSEERRVRKG